MSDSTIAESPLPIDKPGGGHFCISMLRDIAMQCKFYFTFANFVYYMVPMEICHVIVLTVA